MKLGGVRELAAFLQEPVDSVDHWLTGTMRPPVLILPKQNEVA